MAPKLARKSLPLDALHPSPHTTISTNLGKIAEVLAHLAGGVQQGLLHLRAVGQGVDLQSGPATGMRRAVQDALPITIIACTAFIMPEGLTVTMRHTKPCGLFEACTVPITMMACTDCIMPKGLAVTMHHTKPVVCSRHAMSQIPKPSVRDPCVPGSCQQ
eukprot:scaffold188101_cov21-Tisochrysis_lutea.AAC.1